LTDARIHRDIPRPDPALIECLRGIPVADLHDEMSALEQRVRLMAPAMRPVAPGRWFAGPAVTSFNPPGDNLMMHASLYFARAGDVLVATNGGVAFGALWGGNATQQALRKGLAGAVVDGPVRDTATIRELGFPACATMVSVSHPTKEQAGTVNLPVTCAGVVVNPGDIVVGDDDGVVVIAPDDVPRIAAAARARAGRDRALQAAVAAGSTIFEQMNGAATLERLGLRVHDGAWNPAARPA